MSCHELDPSVYADFKVNVSFASLCFRTGQKTHNRLIWAPLKKPGRLLWNCPGLVLYDYNRNDNYWMDGWMDREKEGEEGEG